jgi:hypothetical protein
MYKAISTQSCRSLHGTRKDRQLWVEIVYKGQD